MVVRCLVVNADEGFSAFFLIFYYDFFLWCVCFCDFVQYEVKYVEEELYVFVFWVKFVELHASYFSSGYQISFGDEFCSYFIGC